MRTRRLDSFDRDDGPRAPCAAPPERGPLCTAPRTPGRASAGVTGVRDNIDDEQTGRRGRELRAAATAAAISCAVADCFALDEVLRDLGRPRLRALLGLPPGGHPEPERVVVQRARVLDEWILLRGVV